MHSNSIVPRYRKDLQDAQGALHAIEHVDPRSVQSHMSQIVGLMPQPAPLLMPGLVGTRLILPNINQADFMQ